MRKEGRGSGREDVNVSAAMEAAGNRTCDSREKPQGESRESKINHVLKITVYK